MSLYNWGKIKRHGDSIVVSEQQYLLQCIYCHSIYLCRAQPIYKNCIAKRQGSTKCESWSGDSNYFLLQRANSKQIWMRVACSNQKILVELHHYKILCPSPLEHAFDGRDKKRGAATAYEEHTSPWLGSLLLHAPRWAQKQLDCLNFIATALRSEDMRAKHMVWSDWPQRKHTDRDYESVRHYHELVDEVN